MTLSGGADQKLWYLLRHLMILMLHCLLYSVKGDIWLSPEDVVSRNSSMLDVWRTNMRGAWSYKLCDRALSSDKCPINHALAPQTHKMQSTAPLWTESFGKFHLRAPQEWQYAQRG